MTLKENAPARRRRGTELERALLEATWHELVEQGYAALTMEAVAQRAGTSRPVIYRRWSSKPDLVRASVEHMMRRDRAPAPDTGSLRGDVMALLHSANGRMPGRTALLLYYLGGYFQETATSPGDLRAAALGDQPSPLEEILDRAVARGEADPARLTPRVRTAAVDLLRHEALMSLAPVPDDVIAEIVDEVFLPLVQPR